MQVQTAERGNGVGTLLVNLCREAARWLAAAGGAQPIMFVIASLDAKDFWANKQQFTAVALGDAAAQLEAALGIFDKQHCGMYEHSCGLTSVSVAMCALPQHPLRPVCAPRGAGRRCWCRRVRCSHVRRLPVVQRAAAADERLAQKWALPSQPKPALVERKPGSNSHALRSSVAALPMRPGDGDAAAQLEAPEAAVASTAELLLAARRRRYCPACPH